MSCPFSIGKSQKPQRSPFGHNPPPKSNDPVFFEDHEEYLLPYISPYHSSFFRFHSDASSSFFELPFYLQNSCFHHDYIARFRSMPFMQKSMMANELREAGNRNFNQGLYRKAYMNYEHSIGVFVYVELHKDNSFELFQSPEEDPREEKVRKGLLLQSLLNMAVCLIKMRNFEECRKCLDDSLMLSPYNLRAKAIRAMNVLYNKASKLFDLNLARDDASRAAEVHPEYQRLLELIDDRIHREYGKECKFYTKFFKEVKCYSGIKPASNYEFEHTVIKKLHQEYIDMLKYYSETEEVFSKVSEESKDVQKVLVKMNWIAELSPHKPSMLMARHASAEGVNLESNTIDDAFEGAKRVMICRAFNKGKYNKRILYKNIQEALQEFEQRPQKVEFNEEEEYWFTWQRGLLIFLVLSALLYFLASPSKRSYFKFD